MRGWSGATLLALAGCAAPTPEPAWVGVQAAPVPLIAAPRPPTPTATSAVSLAALSVEQAVLLALQNNQDLQVRSLSPVVAGTFERLERGAFDPEVFADAQYTKERASQTARATGQRFDVSGESSTVRLGVRQRLPTGTVVEAALGHQLDVSNRTPRQQQARLELTVTQALLRGFGPAVNLAAVDQAALEGEASLFELRGFVEALLASTELAYWAYVLATEEIAVYEGSVQLARQEEQDILQRVEVGVLPELELAAARAEVALRAQALIDAKSRREAARLSLVRLVRPDPGGDLAALVTAVSALEGAVSPLTDVTERCALAVRYRPDLGEARVRLRQGDLQTVVTRNGLLPRLDVFVALGKTGFDSRFGDAVGALGGPTYDVRAGLSLGYFLGHRAASAADVAARASARQAARAVENMAELVQLEVRLAANEVERARAQVQASAVTRDLQAEAVVAEKERFEVGSGTALQVARAQRDLLASQIAALRAVADYRAALVRLYQAEGTLLARRGVTVADAVTAPGPG